MINKQTNKGFTLLELLIYISILSILVVVISSSFISLSKGQGQSNAKSEVNNSIRFATELMRQDLKNASIVSTPELPGVANKTPNLVLTRNGVVIIYDVVAGVLRRKEGNAAPVNITNSNISVSTPSYLRIENINSAFNTKNISIKINMIFNYNRTSFDWAYSSVLQSTISLYTNN